MSKKSSILLIFFSLLLVVILIQMAFGTTFRVDADGDRSVIIRAVESNPHGPVPNPPILDKDGNCLNCICLNCHKQKEQKKSAAQTADDHLRKYWPQREYRLAEGQKVRVMRDAYVAKVKGRLMAYEGSKRILLPINAKVIKAGRKYFVLE